jgi:hypothetical protein
MFACEHEHPGIVAVRQRSGDLLLLTFASTHGSSVVTGLVECRSDG